jgi:hypothetical protein
LASGLLVLSEVRQRTRRSHPALQRSTHREHFHPEGSGLGTFHATLNRPLLFHCVPMEHTTPRKVDGHSMAQTYCDAPMWCLADLSVKYTRHVCLIQGMVFQVIVTATTQGKPTCRRLISFGMSAPNLQTAGCSWIKTLQDPRTSTSLSLPSPFD